jgi:GMP synthase (glutamine-hydrolysing)
MSAPLRRARHGKIVVVRTGEPVPRVRERRGEFHDLIRDAIGDTWPGRYEVVDVRAEDATPPAPDAADAFVITGSAANVPDREPWMLRTEAWLREVVAAGTPTFGICFGHQILAQALGGEVQRNPRGREMGTVPVERRGHDPLFEGVPERFAANVTHVDSVVRLPPGAVSLARSALEDHHAIRFSETCYGVQFHPEMDAEVMRSYVEARREILDAEGFQVDAMLANVEEGVHGRETLRNFVRRFL